MTKSRVPHNENFNLLSNSFYKTKNVLVFIILITLQPSEPTTRIDDNEKKMKQLRQDCFTFREAAMKKELELKHSKVLLNCAYEQIEKLKNKVHDYVILFTVLFR